MTHKEPSGIAPPVPLLESPGSLTMDFETWKKIFLNYLDVLGEVTLKEKQKKALLIHSLGGEGQRIFYTLPDDMSTFTTCMAALEKHFCPKPNVSAERYNFSKRGQLNGESFESYIIDLRRLASKC